MTQKTMSTTSFKQFAMRFTLIVGAFIMLIGTPISVYADNFDEQIKTIQRQVDQFNNEASRLRSQGDTLQNALNTLTAQKNVIQAEVNLNQAKYDQLVADITANEKKLDEQQKVMASAISDLAADSGTSPIEVLAGSDNIGDYVDQKEYQSSIRDQLDTSIKQVKQLKAKLVKQKQETEQILNDQKSRRDALAAKEAEQASLVQATRGEEAAYQSMIGQKNSEIEGLRAQQRAANARFIGEAGSGPACGGGYPGKWCNIPMDTVVDNWGMYNRECVSYTAFRVAASGRHMPYWGGVGNANQWDDNARSEGIPVDSSPQAGDVAISNGGYYGHAMYVESVNGDGSISISQYNADWRGTYSTKTISPSGLVFIHF